MNIDYKATAITVASLIVALAIYEKAVKPMLDGHSYSDESE